MGKVSSLEAQVQSLKRERDRLLEVSQNLRISMNKLEKQATFAKINIAQTPREDAGQSARSSTNKNKLLEFTETKIASVNQKQSQSDHQMKQL